LVLRPDPEPTEELFTPDKIKSWSSSLAFHLALLLLLGFTALSRPSRPITTLETRLPAGDPAGSDLGQQLTGGLGIDEPLAMPFAPIESQADPIPTLATPELVAPLSESNSPLRLLEPDSEASARGGGLTLEGSGQAGRGDGFGVAKFGLGGRELINDVEVKVGNPQFTLIWNTSADIDLHVLEPGGSHIYWERRRGAGGGELDVDDVDGYGPENIYWGGGLNRGNGPPGEYKWYVHYYGGREGNLPTRWKVRLKHNGTYKIFEGRLSAIGQRSKIYSFVIDESSSDAQPAQSLPPEDNVPGSSSPDRSAKAPDEPDRPAPGSGRPGFDASPRPQPTAPPRPSGPPRDASGWVIVQPADVGFQALFPAEPFEEMRTLEDRPGQPELHTWRLDRGEGGLAISYLELPPGVRGTPVETLLENEAQALARELETIRAEIRSITIGSVTAREIRGAVPDRLVAGGGRIHARLVVRNGRLFRIEAIGTPEFMARPEVARFLDAFRLPD
jgi:hypothetical protein